MTAQRCWLEPCERESAVVLPSAVQTEAVVPSKKSELEM